MKICLINPPTTATDQEPYFPMALLTLGGALKKAGQKCQLVDFDLLYRQGHFSQPEHFLNVAISHLVATGCAIFGITTICSNFPLAILLAEELKRIKPDCTIILGGPQVSSVPHETLTRFSFIDIVVVGEGENTLVELLRSDLSPSQLATIGGVYFRSDGKIEKAPPRALIENLDDLPWPDYDLIDVQSYVATTIQAGYKFNLPVEAGRGCPFRCTFCSTKNMWEQRFRVKSSARILAEMAAIHEHFGFTYFSFIHDNFTTSRKFILEFSDYMIANNSKNFTWDSSSRTDCIDLNRLEHMHKAGCRGLFFGVETASKRMQKIIKKHLDLDDFETKLTWMSQNGIKATTAFILGFPEETVDDINATLLTAYRFKRAGAYLVQFGQIAALGGTELFHQMRDQLFLTAEETNVTRDRLHLHADRTQALIANHLDIFSSFYALPTPHLPDISYEGVGLFFQKIMSEKLDLLTILLETKKIMPLNLYQQWHEWTKRCVTKKASYGGYYAVNWFPLFVAERFYRHAA